MTDKPPYVDDAADDDARHAEQAKAALRAAANKARRARGELPHLVPALSGEQAK